MAVVTTNLGTVTAYGDAVAAGYTGTKEQWQALMADYATVGTQAAQDAQTASTAATTATTAAQTATTKASEASASATAAAASAASIGTPDTTLTQSGKAADAKAVGDELSTIKEELSDYVVAETFKTPAELKQGYYTKVGEYVENKYYWSSELVSLDGIVPNTTIKVKASLSSDEGSVVFYNAAKEVIDYINASNAVDRGYENTSVIKEIAVIAPQGVAYITTVIRSAYYHSLEDMSVKYMQANYKLADGSVTSGTLADGSVTSNKLAEGSIVPNITSIGKNKLDESKSVSGYIANAIGTIQASDVYKTTDFIEIGSFENKICVSPRLRKALQYDERKIPIRSSLVETTTNAVLEKAQGAKYVRISYFATDAGKMQVEDGTEVTSYEKYVLVLSDEINALNDITKESLSGIAQRDVLHGKKWIPFGDSFTAYTNKNIASGTYINKNATYPRLIAARTGIVIDENFFHSGRTMAYPADHTFTNSATCPTCNGYYQNIPQDADYITIMLGINDLNHQIGSGTTPDGEDATGVITLGTIDDTDTATYCGAYNTVLSWLRENRPFAHVGIIITNGTQREDFTNAQIAIAHKWGYPLLNLNGDDRTPAFIRCYNPNMSTSLKERMKEIQGINYPSNTHPNWQTHEIESNIIENFLRSI